MHIFPLQDFLRIYLSITVVPSPTPLPSPPVTTVSQGERVRILAKPVSNKTSEILPPLTLLAHLLCLHLGQSFTKYRVKTVFLFVILEWGSMKKRIQKKKKKKSNKRDLLPQQQYKSRCKRIHRVRAGPFETGVSYTRAVRCAHQLLRHPKYEATWKSQHRVLVWSLTEPMAALFIVHDLPLQRMLRKECFQNKNKTPLKASYCFSWLASLGKQRGRWNLDNSTLTLLFSSCHALFLRVAITSN